jgi:hypothetical protein
MKTLSTPQTFFGLFLSFVSLPMILMVIGCGPSSDQKKTASANPNPQTSQNSQDSFALTPQPCNGQNLSGIPGAQHCQWFSQNHPYSQFQNTQWNQGAWLWPHQNQLYQTNCGCPQGYRPVTGPTFGVACAPLGYFQNYQPLYFQFQNPYTSYYHGNTGTYQGYAYWLYPHNGGQINIPQDVYRPPTTTETQGINSS